MTLIFVLGGCSDFNPQVPNRAAFDQAVADYLDQRSMGLKISEYKSFELADDGKHAEAEIAMGDASGVIKATERFVFRFEKTDTGWRVISHDQQ